MEIGAGHVFQVAMCLPYPYTDISFDAFAPLNTSGVMSVCSIVVTGTGENYNCLDKESFDYTTYKATGDDAKGNYRARLVMGTVVNKSKWNKKYLLYYRPKLATLQVWTHTGLSLKGKVTILNSLGLLPLISISSVIHKPDMMIKEVDNIITIFFV